MCKDCIDNVFEKKEHHCECNEKTNCSNTSNNESQECKNCDNEISPDDEDDSKHLHNNSSGVKKGTWKNSKGEVCYVDDTGHTCCGTNEEIISHWWPIFKDEKWDIILSLTVGLPLVIHFVSMLFGTHWINEVQNKYLFFVFATILVSFTMPKKLYTAYNEIKNKQFTHIILQVFAIGSVFIYSSIVVLFGLDVSLGYDFDFDCLPFVLVIFAIAEIIENKVIDKINNNIGKETKITKTSKVLIDKNGAKIEIWPSELNVGDKFFVKNGQQIPVDAFCSSENSFFDTSAITGEVKPQTPSIGDVVLSGSINKSKIVELEVKNKVNDSLLASLDRELENLNAKDTQTYAVGQKYLRAILYSIILVSLVNFIVQAFLFGFERAIMTSLAVILITCPCGIASGLPLLFSIFMSESLKNKILVRDLVFIEKIKKIKAFAFDKTGTITSSIASVYEIEGDQSKVKYLNSIEKYSTHPIAQSIVTYLSNKNLESVEFDNIDEISGKGILANIGKEIFLVGSKKLMDANNIVIENIKNDELLSSKGFIIIYMAVNGKVTLKVVLNSKLLDGAKDLISEVNKIGNSYLITGDNEKVGNYISEQVGITKAYCNVSPINKLQIIKEIQTNEPILYVGDGINDSLSLKQSDLSISFSNGSDIAKESAKAILLNHDLKSIVNLIKFSKASSDNMKQAMWITYCYNIITMSLAIGSFVSLEFAPFAEVVSVAIIVFNVWRLKLRANKIFKK